MNPQTQEIKLTQFSHGAGCGCKISPAVLDVILKNNETNGDFPNLLVGNNSRDDAAVYNLGNGKAFISTTDFFMPIVDDAYDFGRIASANAISDVYAMGGSPTLAISILGWPIDKIPPEIAGQVIAGSRAVCVEANIPLAGGHSIDSPEPIFGLAVNGLVDTDKIKQNNTAREGDLLFLTKPLGIGILTTASKKGLLKENDREQAVKIMTTLNEIGAELGKLKSVHALTDVTGFGLLGHLAEMAEGSGLTAEISLKDMPFIDGLDFYLENKCVPGGTNRNWKSYGHKISSISEKTRQLLCDPQTSGGLLVALSEKGANEYLNIAKQFPFAGLQLQPIGRMTAKSSAVIKVKE